MSLAAYLDNLRAGIERALEDRLALIEAPDVVSDAMRYAVMGGGKRFRFRIRRLLHASAYRLPISMTTVIL